MPALRGGDAEENAGIVRAVLAGRAGAHRDVVALNAKPSPWWSPACAALICATGCAGQL